MKTLFLILFVFTVLSVHAQQTTIEDPSYAILYVSNGLDSINVFYEGGIIENVCRLKVHRKQDSFSILIGAFKYMEDKGYVFVTTFNILFYAEVQAYMFRKKDLIENK